MQEKPLRSFANAMHRKRLNLDEMSDYMRRDLGLIDGRPPVCGEGFAETDARSRSFDRLALTPYGHKRMARPANGSVAVAPTLGASRRGSNRLCGGSRG